MLNVVVDISYKYFNTIYFNKPIKMFIFVHFSPGIWRKDVEKNDDDF